MKTTECAFLCLAVLLQLRSLYVSAAGCLGRKAYIVDTTYESQPWFEPGNIDAMNANFGQGGWDQLDYASASSSIFDPSGPYDFIFMEGSDYMPAFYSFYSANLPQIQAWVAAGNVLFANAAPNDIGNAANPFPLGFADVMLYPFRYSSTGTAVDVTNPIFAGPFTPVTTTYVGNFFAHSFITGTVDAIMSGDSGLVLAGKNSGTGFALFGGMTMPNFHDPQPDATNLRDNIIAYAASKCAATVGGDPHVVGFGGEQFDVTGEDDQVYNMFSEENHQINAMFIKCPVTWYKRVAGTEELAKAPCSLIGSLGISYTTIHNFNVSISSKDGISVSYNGEAWSIGTSKDIMPGISANFLLDAYGRDKVFELRTQTFVIQAWPGLEGFEAFGENLGASTLHLNLAMSIVGEPTLPVHGIKGQTLEHHLSMLATGGNTSLPINELDLAMEHFKAPSLFSAEYLVSCFDGRIPSNAIRKVIQLTTSERTRLDYVRANEMQTVGWNGSEAASSSFRKLLGQRSLNQAATVSPASCGGAGPPTTITSRTSCCSTNGGITWAWVEATGAEGHCRRT